MANPIYSEPNVYKFKEIPIKPFWICKDTLPSLLMINRFISMQDICYFKIVPIKTVYLPLAMVLTNRMIMI
jgi:hypothetical protein